jgi:EF-P beta-lysylation protein EpmB
MIARSQSEIEPADWQHALRTAYARPLELLAALGLEAHDVGLSAAAAADFPLRVPRPYVARMRVGDPDDPLLRQVLPVEAETRDRRGYVADPVGDLRAEAAPGLLHKYRGRALLLVTGACAIHCRYCFRRAFPYSDSVGSARLDAAVDALAALPEVDEVILSGGDPLSLRDDRLAALAARLAAIPQLQRLRVHTRLPVTIPARITPALLDWLTGTRLKPVMVLHVNHPREVDATLAHALAPLRAAGVPLLNQAVLLRGINDDAATLAALSRQLFDCGILPYYLHELDRVRGAAHFSVPTRRARALLAELRATLPGYLVPRLVREIAGEPAKTPIA